MATYSILLPGKSHRQRSLTGYSPGGLQRIDMTEQLHNNNQLKDIRRGAGHNGSEVQQDSPHACPIPDFTKTAKTAKP